ncbi:CAP domain-containing protein [Trametes gibbosa]|nr:CAP domain-containing protein [Trametes gibbosa]
MPSFSTGNASSDSSTLRPAPSSPSITSPAPSAPTSPVAGAPSTTPASIGPTAPPVSSPSSVVTSPPSSPSLSGFSTSSKGPSRPITTSAAPVPSPTVGPTERQQYLDQHNSVRQNFNAPPLIWSDDLQQKAQDYAGQCRLQHSNGAFGPLGENLAAATGNFDTEAAVNLFVSDMNQFDPDHVVFSHFTQVVWKSTTQVGCGVALCDNVFPGRKGKATYHVCFYDPVGNVVGQEK